MKPTGVRLSRANSLTSAALSADPLTAAEKSGDRRDIRAAMTMVGGKIVYEMPGWAD